MHSCRCSWRVVGLLGLLAATAIVRGEKLSPHPGGLSRSFRNTTAGGLTGLALPDPYVQHIQDRLTIDAYQVREHAVAPGILPSPRPRYATPPRVEGAVRRIRATLAPGVAAFRATNTESILPPRGFRAPILDNQAEIWPPQLTTAGFAPADNEGVRMVEQQLAADGLIPALVRVIHQFRAESCLANPRAALRRLIAIGYPVDLLHHFHPANTPDASARPIAIIELIARRLIGATNVEAVLHEPFPIRFDFQASSPGLSWINRLPIRVATPEGYAAEATYDLGGRFEIATESGEEEIGLVRMQVGGGWRDGVVPGGSLDVIGQMVDQFRSADFLLSVAADASASMHTLITNSWRLRRRGQVTLCEEPVEPSAWAQDNGKAGRIASRAALPSRWATLLPRFACMDEGKSVFLPGESYLADGLRAAGHPVIHSPLLFQGGNVLCVRQPRTGRRLLVLGEGTVHRNTALGLSGPQVLAAFQKEFGVDECFVLPGLSYHLDFDVSFRSEGSDLTAFVNDTPAAARQIVALGLIALRRHGLLPVADALQLEADLEARRDGEVVASLADLVLRQKGTTGILPSTFSRAFASDPVDDAAGNVQVFLLALDLLESALPAPAPTATLTPAGRPAYLGALRRMEVARKSQMAALQQLGCKIVPVPSMQDLYRSINYLNGLQHRGGYVMPVFGGFYTPLDQAAAAAFRAALGPDLHLAIIRTAECQRMHGGVHCTASVYPRL